MTVSQLGSPRDRGILADLLKTFGIWKPTHLGITGLLFAAAIIHMATAFGG